jgi:RimJ/RimL family protein N-acetyltransferase
MADPGGEGQPPDVDATGTPRFRHTRYGPAMSEEVRIRPVEQADLPIFFAHQADPEAARMAVYPSKDRASFDAHWARILQDETCVTRTVEAGGVVVGNIGSWEQDGERDVGYWIDRAAWGRGIATSALRAFVEEFPERPLHAHVVTTNLGSIRVLEKCGFRRVGGLTSDAEGVIELSYRLDGDG